MAVLFLLYNKQGKRRKERMSFSKFLTLFDKKVKSNQNLRKKSGNKSSYLDAVCYYGSFFIYLFNAIYSFLVVVKVF